MVSFREKETHEFFLLETEISLTMTLLYVKMDKTNDLSKDKITTQMIEGYGYELSRMELQ